MYYIAGAPSSIVILIKDLINYIIIYYYCNNINVCIIIIIDLNRVISLSIIKLIRLKIIYNNKLNINSFNTFIKTLLIFKNIFIKLY